MSGVRWMWRLWYGKSYRLALLFNRFFTEEMVLLRLAVPGRQAGDTVEMEELAAEHEVFVNWNREFQFRHDQWWDPLCPSRVHLDTAGLITTF
ncbi:hypothetical protein ACFSQ7_12005 [Paenibacillus rhizoplanae]